MKKFFNWLFSNHCCPEYDLPPKPSKEERIKELEKKVREQRDAMDAGFRKEEQKFLDENTDKYKLVVVTDEMEYESEEIKASAHTHTRWCHSFMGGFHSDRERELEYQLMRGPYEYAMTDFRTAKINAEAAANGIMNGTHYFHQKTNSYIPAQEIKLVRVVKVVEG